MEKPIPMHLWRHWNGSDSTRNRLSLDEFPSNYTIVPNLISSVGKLMCSQRVQIASGSDILTHASFLLLPVKLFSIILRRFDVIHRLVSIERHPASSPTHLDIPPSLLSSMSFLPKVCTLHSVSPLHLAATTSKVRGVFNVVSCFFFCFFFGGFCEQVEGLLDCYDDLTYKCFWTKDILKD